MKMIRKLMAMILTVMMLAGSAAWAAELKCAALPADMAALERYPSFACDEATGKWCVRANEADGLMDRFWTYGKANGTALCAFTLEIEGNVHTGVRTPVLRFYYIDGLEIDASAVSILIGDTRYDLAADSSDTVNERHTAEVITAPLTRESIELIEDLKNAEEASVRLLGERIYTFELDMDTTNSRRRIETASLSGMASAAVLMDEAGFDSYDLWDLSSAAWKNEYGFEPSFAKSTVVKAIGETEINDDFGMVIRGSQTKAAKTAQEILIAHGFMSGTATSTFGENSASATRRAQHYLGMIGTGCMDAQLEKALSAGVKADDPAANELTELGGNAAVCLDRYWFAGGVAPENMSGNFYTVANGDNVFLAADGTIRNISGGEMRLFTQVTAKIVYNDSYTFEADVVCERDGGTALDMVMLPMAQARLIVYGEVPAWLAEDENASWTIELSADGESIEYILQ